MAKKTDKKNDKESGQMRLNFVGLTKDDERPEIVVKATDAKAQTIHVSNVDPKGNFDIPQSVLKKAHRIIIGTDVGDDKSPDSENVIKYRTAQFVEILDRGVINIAKPVWERWYFRLRCVTGKVRLCRRHPLWY